MKGCYIEENKNLFFATPDNRTRSNGLTLQESRLPLKTFQRKKQLDNGPSYYGDGLSFSEDIHTKAIETTNGDALPLDFLHQAVGWTSWPT